MIRLLPNSNSLCSSMRTNTHRACSVFYLCFNCHNTWLPYLHVAVLFSSVRLLYTNHIRLHAHAQVALSIQRHTVVGSIHQQYWNKYTKTVGVIYIMKYHGSIRANARRSKIKYCNVLQLNGVMKIYVRKLAILQVFYFGKQHPARHIKLEFREHNLILYVRTKQRTILWKIWISEFMPHSPFLEKEKTYFFSKKKPHRLSD